jgi:hypothetical protein
MFYEYSSSLFNNYFIISLYNMNGITDVDGKIITEKTYKITIPDGNYTSDAFQSILNTYFVNVGIDFLICVIDGITSKTLIRTCDPIDIANNPKYNKRVPYLKTQDFYDGSGNYNVGTNTNPYYSPDFYFVLDFTTQENKNLNENLGWMMGYRKNQYRIDKTLTHTDYIFNPSYLKPFIFYGYALSESSFGSNYTNYLYLEVDDYNRNCQTNTIYGNTGPESYISNNILARITLNNVPYTIVEKNSSDHVSKKREYYGPVKLEKLRIRLLNRYGKVVDMNNNNYSMLLECKQIYS